MNIPADLQGMYNHCLDLASKDIEKTPVSPEFLLALIERIAEVETDSKNLNSYIHFECHKATERQAERANNLAIENSSIKQQIIALTGKNDGVQTT